MGRLYYEAPPGPAMGVDTGKGEKKYLEKVASLVPAEIIAGYLTLVGIVPLIRNEALHSWFYWAILVLCLGLTPIYLNAQAEKGKPKKRHLIVSTFAFVFWAYATSGAVIVPVLYDAAIA